MELEYSHCCHTMNQTWLRTSFYQGAQNGAAHLIVEAIDQPKVHRLECPRGELNQILRRAKLKINLTYIRKAKLTFSSWSNSSLTLSCCSRCCSKSICNITSRVNLARSKSEIYKHSRHRPGPAQHRRTLLLASSPDRLSGKADAFLDAGRVC